jgi:hypothetical protein
MTAERRKHPRSRLLRRARIVFRDGYSSVDCVVLDISVGGARLRYGEWLGIPRRFELRLENGPRRIAEIRHRSHDGTGVRFVDGEPA